MNEKTPFLLFCLDKRPYALRLSRVERVVRSVDATPLPGSPDIVLGAINFQGRVVPVLNIRERFGFPGHGISPQDQFIIAETCGRRVALVVDEVRGVAEWPEADIAAAERALYPAAQVEGLVRLGDDLVVIHDLDKFLSPDEEKALTHSLRG